MLSITYINSNNGTLLITLSDKDVNNIKNYNNYSLLFNNNELIGINIFDINNEFKFQTGLVYPNEQLLNWIKYITNHSLKKEVNFVVAKVEECQNIENTHLHKCIIFDGNNKYDVVCGAKNVKRGLKVVLAKNNTIMPNGKIILAGVVMGIKSEGMLCSARELKLKNESNGIIELDDSYYIGNEFLEVYKNRI